MPQIVENNFDPSSESQYVCFSRKSSLIEVCSIIRVFNKFAPFCRIEYVLYISDFCCPAFALFCCVLSQARQLIDCFHSWSYLTNSDLLVRKAFFLFYKRLYFFYVKSLIKSLWFSAFRSVYIKKSHLRISLGSEWGTASVDFIPQGIFLFEGMARHLGQT